MLLAVSAARPAGLRADEAAVARAGRLTPEEQRRAVGRAAAERVRDGEVVGLGTGRTASEFVRALGERVQRGELTITGVPTSERTAALARSFGIRLVEPAEVDRLDVTYDGADEVAPSLDLVKGLGGALVREKIVARKSERLVILADRDKLVAGLGQGRLPVEVVPDQLEAVRAALEALGATASVRQDGAARFRTDNGNTILDLRLSDRLRRSLLRRAGRVRLARALEAIPGVVDHGLFLGLTTEVLVGDADGRVVSKRPRSRR